MAAKDVKFSSDARERMLRGVDIMANAVRVTHLKAESASQARTTPRTRATSDAPINR